MDIKTLFIYISVSSIYVLLLSIHVYWRHSRFIRGSLYWVASIFAISVASILFGLGSMMPMVLRVNVSNSLLLLCPTLMSLSFRRLYSRSLWLPIILYVLSFLIFNLIGSAATLNERIILFGILFGILWLDPTYLTLRKENRKYEGLLGASFLFVSVCSFLRVGSTVLYEKELDTLLDGGFVQQTYIMSMGLILFLFLAGYILMLNYRYLERIQSNEATLRAAIDDSPYAMVTTDPSGHVVSINATFKKITGYSLPEMQQGGLGLLQSGRQDQTFQEIWETLLSGRDWQGELFSRRKDGSCFWERAAWNPIKAESGQITGFFGVMADITQKRQLEDFRTEVDHLMRHDLKTPLNAVINLPDIIQSEEGLSPEQLECLDLIRESGESMLEQINNSLEMVKFEEGTHRVEMIPTDLRAVLSTLRKTLLPLANLRNVAITYSYTTPETVEPDAPLMFSTDRPLFKRLVSNLLKNAIEASPERGAVNVCVSLQAEELFIAIHNAGAIPPEVRSRFFSKFNTFGKLNGTGLGVYAAKLIAGSLGYALTFTTDEQTGTTLTIRMPHPEITAIG